MRRWAFRAVLALTSMAVLVTVMEAVARPPRTEPSPVMPKLVNVDLIPRTEPPAAATEACADSLYLLGGPGTLSGKFEDAAGAPDRQGWTGVDRNQATEVHWQVSTFNAAELDTLTPGNHAWWCGDLFASCDVDDPPEGYGDNWYEYLDWLGTVPDPTRNATVRIQAVISYDVEPAEDYLHLRVDNSEWMEDLASFTYRGTAQVVDVTTTLTPDNYVGTSSDQIHLRWDFHSDGAWSDEDCRWSTAGAAQIDLIRVFIDQGAGEIQMGTTETCEAGDPLQWQPTTPRGPGDFSKVWPQLDDADPASDNDTPQFAFIDDGVVVPGTGGYPCTTHCYGPGGFIVNPGRALADLYVYVHNEIWSPVLAVPAGNWTGAEFSFDQYVHAELDNGGAYVVGLWHVRSTADPTGTTGWTEWRDRNFALWGSPRYVREIQSVSDLLVPGFTHVQLALGVMNLYGALSTDGTPAPYFDNVSLKVFDRLAPRSLLVRPDGSGDLPTIQAAINAAADQDTVLLTDGVFSGDGNRDLYLLGKEITICSASGDPATCIIDAQGSPGDNHRAFAFSQEEGPGTVVSGLTMTGGYRDAVSSPVFYSGGAVICRPGSAPTISNCRFLGNHSVGTNQLGGAVYCDDAGPLITDCVFEDNVAFIGGALAAEGLSSPVIDNCLFLGNECLSQAAAVYGYGSDAHVTISSSTFVGNVSPLSTGTLVSHGGGRFDIDHSIFTLGAAGYVTVADGADDFRFACSDIHGNARGDWYGLIADQLGVDGNIDLDPAFCMASNPAAPYYLHEDSPCGPSANAACGLIGYGPVGCAALSAAGIVPAHQPRIQLHPCYPNPFNPRTTLSFSLRESAEVDLAIYNLKGELVKRLVSDELEGGKHNVRWNGKDGRGADLASGVYFARLVSGSETMTRRLMLLR